MDHKDTDPGPRKLTKAECGRLGGNTTKARHGREHYVRAGKLGFVASAKAHAAGIAKANVLWLRARGKMTAPELTPEEKTARLRALRSQLLEDNDHDQR